MHPQVSTRESLTLSHSRLHNGRPVLVSRSLAGTLDAVARVRWSPQFRDPNSGVTDVPIHLACCSRLNGCNGAAYPAGLGPSRGQQRRV
jgi:hypothetical protein